MGRQDSQTHPGEKEEEKGLVFVFCVAILASSVILNGEDSLQHRVIVTWQTPFG